MSPYGKYREHYKPVVFGFSKEYFQKIQKEERDSTLLELIEGYISWTSGEDRFFKPVWTKLIRILNGMKKSYKEGLALVTNLFQTYIIGEIKRQVYADDKNNHLTENEKDTFVINTLDKLLKIFTKKWKQGCMYKPSAERSLPVTVSAKGSTYSFVPVDKREDVISDRPPGWDEWLSKHDNSKEYPYKYDMTLQLKGKLKRTREKVRLEKKSFYELLTPGKNVNAKIIDYYLLMLQDRENLRCDARMQGINVYFYDTEFYIAYRESEKTKKLNRSEPWYYHIWKTRDLDYAYVRYLFIPVAFTDHYTCFMIDIWRKKVYYYDSLHYHVPIKFLHTFGEYVVETQRPESREALGWLVEVKNDFENADGNVRRNEHLIVYNDVQQEVPRSDDSDYYDRANDLQQEDGKPTRYYDRANDCAMFVCQFMKELSKDPENLAYYLENDLKNDDDEYSHHFPHCFEPGRGNYYRRRMAEEIRTNSLDHPIAYETPSYSLESVGKQKAINTLLPYIPYYHYLHGQAFALSVEELNEIIGYMESNFPCVNCKRKCRVCDNIRKADAKRSKG
jgi:hypothetical protein